MAAAATLPTPRAVKLPASYKLDSGTRKNVDLLSTALGVDKSTVITRAVKILAEHHTDDLRRYIEQATVAIERGGDWAYAEALTGLKHDPKYRGGSAKRK